MLFCVQRPSAHQLAKPKRIGKGGRPIAFYSPLIPRGTYGNREFQTGPLLSRFGGYFSPVSMKIFRHPVHVWCECGVGNFETQ
jgi:hypothetical protein